MNGRVVTNNVHRNYRKKNYEKSISDSAKHLTVRQCQSFNVCGFKKS